MSTQTQRLLFWTPRVLVLVFAAFVSLFALDVFGVGYSPWETVVALMMHLIPTALILVALGIAWRWELVGAGLFLGLAVLYLITAGGRFPWSVYVIMCGPPTLIAVLFALDWQYRQRAARMG